MQDGQSPYIFPVMDFPMGLYDLIGYEQGRGMCSSTLRRRRPSTLTIDSSPKNRVVPFIQYQYNSPTSPGFSIATLNYTDQSLVKGNKDFDEAVAAYGFEKQASRSPDQVYALCKEQKDATSAPGHTVLRQGEGRVRLQSYTEERATRPSVIFPLRSARLPRSRELDMHGGRRWRMSVSSSRSRGVPAMSTPELYDLFTPETSPFQGE